MLTLTFQSGAASFRGLGRLPGGEAYSAARAVSADGSTVVGSSGSANGFREAFCWTEAGGMHGLGDLGLNLTGWRLSSASGISADGTVIVGTGYNPASQQEAWRAVVPELFRPWLNVALTQGGDGVRLSWSARFAGFQLQEAPTLNSPQWTAVDGTPEVENEQYVIVLPLSGRRFYRLAH